MKTWHNKDVAGGWEENEEGKGNPICGDERLGFRWWAHKRVYKYHVKLYTWNLYNVINQYYPINWILKIKEIV